MKYKIILKTTHKHFLRIERCMKYWLKDQDVVCASDKIINLDIPQLSASDKDTHGVSSEEKTVFMFNHIKNNQSIFGEYDWFIFIDDDAILNTQMLNYILPYLNKKNIYGINMQGSYPKDTSLVYPSGGGGYLVSNQTIIDSAPMVNHQYFHEDVSVGRYMKDNNILLNNKISINGRNYHVRMNGWYPFQKIKESLYKDGIVNESDVLNFFKRLDSFEPNIINHLTHHYITSDICMDLIHTIFKQWTPEILLRSNNLV